jgi:ferritin-like metal-binding protein YciE
LRNKPFNNFVRHPISPASQLSRMCFVQHLGETEEHESSVRERLEAHGAAPSKVKDLVMRAGGAGFVLFAASQTDTPGKLTSHAFSYEHLESAAYELPNARGRAGR